MSLINITDWLKKQDPLSVPLKGKVVENNDPKRLGRVKVRIEGVLESIDITLLPWIYPKNPIGFGGSQDASSLVAPDVGAELTIEFPHREIYFGFYTGYWQSELNNQGLFAEDYPNTYGFRDTQNTYYKVNRAKRFAEFRHTSRSFVRFEREGQVIHQTPHSLKIQSEDLQSSLTFDAVGGKYIVNPLNEHGVITDLFNVKVDRYVAEMGADTKKVIGARAHTVLGASVDAVGGSRSTATAGNASESVLGTYSSLVSLTSEQVFGRGLKRTIIEGDFQDIIKKGNYSQETMAGSFTRKNPAFTETVAAGGAVSMKTSAGLKWDIGAGVDFKISAAMKVKAGPEIELKAGEVKFNGGTSPVLTEETDPLIDLITGAPTVGVPTVKAGP